MVNVPCTFEGRLLRDRTSASSRVLTLWRTIHNEPEATPRLTVNLATGSYGSTSGWSERATCWINSSFNLSGRSFVCEVSQRGRLKEDVSAPDRLICTSGTAGRSRAAVWHETRSRSRLSFSCTRDSSLSWCRLVSTYLSHPPNSGSSERKLKLWWIQSFSETVHHCWCYS